MVENILKKLIRIQNILAWMDNFFFRTTDSKYYDKKFNRRYDEIFDDKNGEINNPLLGLKRNEGENAMTQQQ